MKDAQLTANDLSFIGSACALRGHKRIAGRRSSLQACYRRGASDDLGCEPTGEKSTGSTPFGQRVSFESQRLGLAVGT